MTSLVERLRDSAAFCQERTAFTIRQTGINCTEAADTIEALCEALQAIQNVRVDRDDNIWAGSDKCRAIAKAALERVS